ncbi:hypothetical protein C8Q72DRAFT_535141 [Fomitopsis betulina]|nr:hypothetical protein C8Q72DRAFT_535141 [Fomitopsis betulina]
MSSFLDTTSNLSSAQSLDYSPPSLKRKRSVGPRSPALSFPGWYARDDSDSTCSGEADSDQVEQALSQCYNTDNAVYSCFPTSDTVISQHEWVHFVWNSKLPQFHITNAVDIFLYNADSSTLIQTWTNQVNPASSAGQVSACVNDSWWGGDGANWNGENITSQYFFAITPTTQTGVAYQSPISTFAAVQTTYADWVVASMSSASAASVSSAAAASSRATVTSASSATTTVGTGVGSGSSLSDGAPTPSATGASGSGTPQSLNSNKFPGWAIAVIVVLGFLALVAAGVIAFLVTRRMKQRRNSMLSHRGSMNSASPMMANAANAQSPLLASALLGGAAGAAEAGEHRPTSPTEGHDGASTMSRTSADPGLFSGADAAILAAAFRSQLRKPDFTERPVEEESESPGSRAIVEQSEVLLGRELAEEGRDIRSVDSSRGVRVETLSDTTDDDGATAATTIHDDDDAGTVHDHRY